VPPPIHGGHVADRRVGDRQKMTGDEISEILRGTFSSKARPTCRFEPTGGEALLFFLYVV
jgi:hypothetical protein